MKQQNLGMLPEESIVNKIYLIRDQKVMIDRDLAELYGVETKRLKEAVRRNIERFPEDFMFELTSKELKDWRTQFATSKSDLIGLRHPASLSLRAQRSNGIRHLVSGIRHPASGIRHQASGIRYPLSGIHDEGSLTFFPIFVQSHHSNETPYLFLPGHASLFYSAGAIRGLDGSDPSI